MPRRSLTPDVALDVLLSAICSRHCFDADPAECLAEVQRVARRRPDILARVAGEWVGYYRTEHTTRLCDGLLTIPGSFEYVAQGVERRAAPIHGSHGFRGRA